MLSLQAQFETALNPRLRFSIPAVIVDDEDSESALKVFLLHYLCWKMLIVG
jgi:hypothetical protein